MGTTVLIILAIILGIFISSLLIYVILNFDNLTFSHIRETQRNQTKNEQFPQKETLKQKEEFYKHAEFVNKNCTNLEEFIINDEINSYDLRKLSDLNDIQLQIKEGWYPLTIELIKELNENGWDKKVSCIKEKWAKLEFYTSQPYNSTIHEIIWKYGEKSLRICETCGESGDVRYNRGWQYIACRKHYLKIRGKITTDKLGFNYRGNFYTWKDIKDATFRDLNLNKKYNFINIEFNKYKIINTKELNVFSDFIGYGNFLNQLPKNLKSLDYSYIKNFFNSEFCEICGYKAVYFEECECCENKSWIGHLTRWNKKIDQKENTKEERHEYIKWNQIFWILDEGDIYEGKQNNYLKNSSHKILFTETELREAKDDFENN